MLLVMRAVKIFVKNKKNKYTLRSHALWWTNLKIIGKEELERQITFILCKVLYKKLFSHNAKGSPFFLSFSLSPPPPHFYDILSNFPSKILFLPSTGHHPQKYHIQPSSDWIVEWLFWSLALSPLSLISRDQQTGSYNLQTDLNHNSELRKCFEVKKISVYFTFIHLSTSTSWNQLNAKWCQVTWCLRNLDTVWILPWRFTKHFISSVLFSTPN